jgi:peptidoglycan/LPS O-acetylase OafA/YrhL
VSKHHIQITSFSITQTEILKGIGILIIVLHNFFHNLTPIIGQSQFRFDSHGYSKFYLTIADSPLELLRAGFSYFGHYGVQIFIFFSAYGLTKKYLHTNIQLGSFLSRRLGKIYASFLICVVVYILLGIAKEQFITSEQVLYWDSLLWKVLLISSFLPNEAMKPVGPWWFMPFIFQVYLCYPLLLWAFKRFGSNFLIILSLASMLTEWLLNPYLIENGLNINFMVFGHLPVLSLGIYLAAQDRIRLSYNILGLSLILFVFGNYNQTIWITADLAFTILALGITMVAINKRLELPRITTFLAFYGGVSFHLFMVNGFLRSLFHNFAEAHNVWWIDNLAALGSLIFSTMFAILLSKLDRQIRLIISQ